MKHGLLFASILLLLGSPLLAEEDAPQPTTRTIKEIEGWKVRVDDRLLSEEHQELTNNALTFLAAKLVEIKIIMPTVRVEEMQKVAIVLDLNCGKLRAMQYHPDAGWLKNNGFNPDLAKCVHLPRASDLATKRNVNEQPWVILHELSHAWHDQVLGFDAPVIRDAFEKYKESGHGEKTLLHNGKRVKHYALTNHKEFFAEMSEAFFGSNDFFPFNRAELMEAEPELYATLTRVWIPAK